MYNESGSATLRRPIVSRPLVRPNLAPRPALTPAQEFGRAQEKALHALGFSFDQLDRIIKAGSVCVAVWAVEFVVELAHDGYGKSQIFEGIERVRKSVWGVETFHDCFPGWEVPNRFSVPQIFWAFLDSVEEAMRIGIPIALIEDNK